MERDALWRMVMDAKYGSMWGSWCSNSVQGPYEFCLWKSIGRVGMGMLVLGMSQ